MPRSVSRSASSRLPSSEKFSETRSGRSVQPAMAAARASTSPPVIHRPVVSEISTRSGRSARTTAAVAAGSSVSWPSASRGWAWIETAPARDTGTRVRGQLLRRERDARVAVAVQAGLEEAMPPGRTPRPAAPRRSGTSSACRPAGSARARRRSCRPARRRWTARTAARSRRRPRRRERTLSRIAHGDSAPSTSTGGPTSTSSTSSEPGSSPSESSVDVRAAGSRPAGSARRAPRRAAPRAPSPACAGAGRRADRRSSSRRPARPARSRSCSPTRPSRPRTRARPAAPPRSPRPASRCPATKTTSSTKPQRVLVIRPRTPRSSRRSATRPAPCRR